MYKAGQLDADDTFFFQIQQHYLLFLLLSVMLLATLLRRSSISIIHFARQLHYGMQIKDLRKVLVWDLVG